MIERAGAIERLQEGWPVVVFGLVVAALLIYFEKRHRRQMSAAVRGYVRRVSASRWEFGVIRSVKDQRLQQALGYRHSLKAALAAADRVLRPLHDRRPMA